VQVVVLAACEPRGHRFERWPLHIAQCETDLPLIISSRPRTVREPTALDTSFFNKNPDLVKFVDKYTIQQIEVNKACFLVKTNANL